MRCARSTSVRASGGVNPIVSLINNNTFCSMVPFVSSGIPWIRRFGRLEYCSWQSTSSSRCHGLRVYAVCVCNKARLHGVMYYVVTGTLRPLEPLGCYTVSPTK